MAQDETASKDPRSGPPATESRDRGIFLPLIFGGAVAAALGFFGSQIDAVERALGLAPPDTGLQEAVDAQAGRITEQADRIAAQAEEIAALAERVDGIPDPPPPPDLSRIESRLSDQATRIEELAARLEEVEKRPMTENVSEDAIAAYEEELSRLQSAVAEQRAEIEAILQQAQEADSDADRMARLAQARAAGARIIAALDNGASFSAELEVLRAAGRDDLPEVLTGAADDGVATLGELQADFPQVARAGLSAARDAAAASGEGGLGTFLQRQLGARSVVPQDGDDPDAVLSRAEAAVRQGRLGDALSEIEALPDAARNAMGDWIARAEARHAAIRAAQDVMTALDTN